MKIEGKTFLITGGSSGLGSATAQLLVECNANVIVADLNVEDGQKIVAKLGDKSQFIKADVTSESNIKQAISLAVDTYHGLHGSINCAGIVSVEKIVSRRGTHSLEKFIKVMNINLVGTFNVARLVAETLSKSDLLPSGERGVIINTASIAAFDGQIGQVAYAASKGGVVGMTLPLARDLAKSGIRVMTIAPGIFDTPMIAGLPEKARTALAQQVPFPSRFGNPTEFASLVKQIIENGMLNGTVIRLDGAIRMPPK